jgi:hypothetical protein
MNFAKLFSIDDDTQVLVRLEDGFDETTGEEITNVTQTTEYNGVTMECSKGFLEVKDAEEYFKKFSLALAITFHEDARKVIFDMVEEG